MDRTVVKMTTLKEQDEAFCLSLADGSMGYDELLAWIREHVWQSGLLVPR